MRVIGLSPALRFGGNFRKFQTDFCVDEVQPALAPVRPKARASQHADPVSTAASVTAIRVAWPPAGIISMRVMTAAGPPALPAKPL
jgi:hypothetical protein